jgi:hypothetical protein
MTEFIKMTLQTRIAIGTCLLLSLSTACSDSGGKARTAGAGINPSTNILDVDFALRRDLDVSPEGGAFLGDALHMDLDDNGVVDLIVTDFLGQKLYVALGQADGTFETIIERDTAGKAFRLAVGEFSGDSLLDIAVANRNRQGEGTPSIEVFIQGAGMTFSTPPLWFPTVSNPSDLAAAFSFDGESQDLFVAVPDLGQVLVLATNGGTSLSSIDFLSSDNLAGGVGQPFSLAFVSEANSEYSDLVVGEIGVFGMPDRVIIYNQSRQGEPLRGGGRFDAARLLVSPAFRPVVDNVGDVNGDTFEDVGVAQMRSDDALLIPNSVTGFGSARTIFFGGPTTSLIFPDLNGDGMAEVVATTLNNSSIQVRPGTDSLSWGEATHYNVGPVPRAIAPIMLPGDMIPDLLCANISDLTVMVGLGDGSFRCAKGYDSGFDRPGKFLASDLDANGTIDYVAISAFQTTISFHTGLGDGSFAVQAQLPMSSSTIDTPTGLAVADFDLDGDLDVLATVGSANEVRIYRNQGSIAGFVDAGAADIISVGTRPSSLAVADFNLDGRPDFVVCNTGDETIQLFFNNEDGSFSAQAAIDTTLLIPTGVKCADFDSDGNMDLVVTGRSALGFEARIYGGEETEGSLSQRSFYVLDDVVDSIELADFNSDGVLDVVIGQSTFSSDHIFVLMSSDDTGLGFNMSRLFVGLGPANVMVGDLDRDSNLDILVATSEGELRILIGDGLGDFGAARPGRGELPSIENCFSASLVDVNGDALPDVLTVSKDSRFMWVGSNVSTGSSVTQ